MEGLNFLVQRIQLAGLDSFFNLPIPRFRIKFDKPFAKSVELKSRRESQYFLFDFFNVTHETRSLLLSTNKVYHKPTGCALALITHGTDGSPLTIPPESLGFFIGGALKPSGFLQDQSFEIPQPEPGRIKDVVVVKAGQFG